MKAQRLPQEEIVRDIVGNLQEVIWSKAFSGVRKLIEMSMETLLKEELAAKIGARRYQRTKNRRAYRNGRERSSDQI